MKTFEEIRREVINDISTSGMMGLKDKNYSFAQIETLAAKEYAKQWVEKALQESIPHDVTSLVELLHKEIDAQ